MNNSKLNKIFGKCQIVQKNMNENSNKVIIEYCKLTYNNTYNIR